MSRLPFRVETIKGPWFSFGVHVDLQAFYMDIHFIWWIVTIGFDYFYRLEHFGEVHPNYRK